MNAASPPSPAAPTPWLARIVVIALGALALTPWASGGTALLAGIAVALTVKNPFAQHTGKLSGQLLRAAVVGLGFGMNLAVVISVGLQGLGATFLGIAVALGIGTLLARLLRVPRDVGLLVSVGTAICGGSAIAAVSSSIGAKKADTTVALAVVFLLNAAGLLIFPPIGHALGFDETQFGVWAALAIHDTSSVVGAAGSYGPHALEVATTIKLARALWIVPVSLAAGAWAARRAGTTSTGKRDLPWFILGFVAAAAFATYVPGMQPWGVLLAGAAKHVFVLSLFLIGAGLSREALKSVGPRPFVLGVGLWIVSAVASGLLAGYGLVGGAAR